MYSLMCVLRTSVHTHTHTKAYLSPQVCGSASARVCVNFGGWHGADSQMEKFAACEHVSGQIKKKKKKKESCSLKQKGTAGFTRVPGFKHTLGHFVGSQKRTAGSSPVPSALCGPRPVPAHPGLGVGGSAFIWSQICCCSL